MIAILFYLVIIGVGLYVVNAVIPMAQPIKLIINCVVVLLVLAWLLNVFGLLHVPQYRLR